MIEYLQHHGLGHSSLSTRLKIFAKVCELVHSKGQEEISQAAFDWQVDRALWKLHFQTFRPSRRPAWPWLDLWPRVLADPGPKSSEYREYLQDHPLVVPTTVPVSGARAPPAVLPGHVVPQSSQPVLPAVSAGAAGQPSPSGDIGNTHAARRGRPAPKASSI
ncbi:hypothetical protein PLICBS_005274 [Purpureocillium lilacinum]|uniref:uncharacterized protein n=1 Tax=Purpureocillium lilacinum TaxID=33203 RepID=UPI0020848616|nr:hypothetical protein PLICBS_005274 [Purpureocillium lilacinum]